MAGRRKVCKKVRNGQARGRNAKVGCDFIQRNEDEGSLSQARMRNLEAGLGENKIAVEQEVEIEGAWAVGNRARAIASEETLNREKRVKERAWRKIGFKRDDGVEKARLIGNADGRGGIKRGTRGDAAESGDSLKGGGERGIRRTGGAG